MTKSVLWYFCRVLFSILSFDLRPSNQSILLYFSHLKNKCFLQVSRLSRYMPKYWLPQPIALCLSASAECYLGLFGFVYSSFSSHFCILLRSSWSNCDAVCRLSWSVTTPVSSVKLALSVPECICFSSVRASFLDMN